MSHSITVEPLTVLLDGRQAIHGGYRVLRDSALIAVFPADTHPAYSEHELLPLLAAEVYARDFAADLEDRL